jgi:hypothetical protein
LPSRLDSFRDSARSAIASIQSNGSFREKPTLAVRKQCANCGHRRGEPIAKSGKAVEYAVEIFCHVRRLVSQIGAHQQILARRHIGEKTSRLEDGSDFATYDLRRRQCGNVFARQAHPAALRL